MHSVQVILKQVIGLMLIVLGKKTNCRGSVQSAPLNPLSRADWKSKLSFLWKQTSIKLFHRKIRLFTKKEYKKAFGLEKKYLIWKGVVVYQTKNSFCVLNSPALFRLYFPQHTVVSGF